MFTNKRNMMLFFFIRKGKSRKKDIYHNVLEFIGMEAT